MNLPSLSTLSPEQIWKLCCEVGFPSVPKFYWPTISLDAVAKLEAGLTDDEHVTFRWRLRCVTKDDVYSREYVSAFALQRASAYLLTKGLVTL